MKLPLQADLPGRLLRRYKRFFADVETRDGGTLTVHCPNPGSMLGLDRSGAAVRCSDSHNPARKLRYTLEMVRDSRTWVGVNPGRANTLVAQALDARALRPLAAYAGFDREVSVGEGSRLDFRLHGHRRDERPAFLEVKSVTLAAGPRARFPDSVTERGRRHLQVLQRLRREGARSLLLFVVQRADCEVVEPADDIDPAYGAELRNARKNGVEIVAVRSRVTPTGIRLEGRVPVRL